MTIAPSDCPLDGIRSAPQPGSALADHYHDPCDCLDKHQWTRLQRPIGAEACTRCAALRCSFTDDHHNRCIRRASHRGGRHLYERGS